MQSRSQTAHQGVDVSASSALPPKRLVGDIEQHPGGRRAARAAGPSSGSSRSCHRRRAAAAAWSGCPPRRAKQHQRVLPGGPATPGSRLTRVTTPEQRRSPPGASVGHQGGRRSRAVGDAGSGRHARPVRPPRRSLRQRAVRASPQRRLRAYPFRGAQPAVCLAAPVRTDLAAGGVRPAVRSYGKSACTMIEPLPSVLLPGRVWGTGRAAADERLVPLREPAAPGAARPTWPAYPLGAGWGRPARAWLGARRHQRELYLPNPVSFFGEQADAADRPLGKPSFAATRRRITVFGSCRPATRWWMATRSPSSWMARAACQAMPRPADDD